MTPPVWPPDSETIGGRGRQSAINYIIIDKEGSNCVITDEFEGNDYIIIDGGIICYCAISDGSLVNMQFPLKGT